MTEVSCKQTRIPDLRQREEISRRMAARQVADLAGAASGGSAEMASFPGFFADARPYAARRFDAANASGKKRRASARRLILV